jgi:hypothetical protein
MKSRALNVTIRKVAQGLYVNISFLNTSYFSDVSSVISKYPILKDKTGVFLRGRSQLETYHFG